MLVTFLSDFGLDDPFVGLCHAVVAQRAPAIRIVDLSHAVPPGDVRRGACRLADCVAWIPAAVHLAVVDPGVGTARRGLIMAAGNAFLVGPDNGLLLPAADTLGGAGGAWGLSVPAGASATFHGRDVFAPAASALATGILPDELGEPVEVDELVRLALPEPSWGARLLRTEVRDIDRFGNVQLWARGADADARGLRLELAVTVTAHKSPHPARRVATFADTDGIGLLVDSLGWLALTIEGGSAAAKLSLNPGDDVALEWDRPAQAG